MTFSYPLNKGVRNEQLPPYVLFIDTETRELPDGQLELILGCYEVWETDPGGVPDTLIDSGEFWQESGFYDLLYSYAPCRCVAHNWRFDAAVLRVGATDNMGQYGYHIDVARSILPTDGAGLSPFLITLAMPTGSVELLDNTNFYKLPLADLGESLGIPKLDMPPESDIPAMLDYCRRDTEILRMAYQNLFRFTQDIAGTTPGITAAMAGNRVFRKGYYQPGRTRVQGTLHIPYVNAAERSAYHGGRTDVFYKGVPRRNTVRKYDINSLYPSCMLGAVPVRYNMRGLPDWAEQYVAAFGTGGGDAIILTDVTLRIPPESRYGFLGLEGVKIAGDLVFPVGTFRCWVWQPILAIAFEQGYVHKIHNVFVYDAEPLFRGFVQDMYAKRIEYRESGNKAFADLCKLLMNSLYGKFAQRENLKWAELSDADNEYHVMRVRGIDGMERWRSDEYAGVETDYLQIQERLWAMPDRERNLARGSVISVAGYITALGRAVLWRGMAGTLDGGGELYMADTDSIVTSGTLPSELVSDTELGKYKLEQESPGSDCLFLAPKHYVFGGGIKMKGVRNPEPGATEHTQIQFPNFVTDLVSKNPKRRARLESGAVLTRIVKKPTGRNTKRVEIGDNLPTLPIHLTVAESGE